MYTALHLIKDQIADARITFLGTVENIKPAHLHRDPGGKALPLGALIAHLIFSEDVLIHSMLLGKSPLYETSWREKTGASAPMPAMDNKWEETHREWSKSVRVTLTQMLEYAHAVFADTDKYLSTLSEKDVVKEIDLGSWGKKTIASFFTSFIIAHMNNLTGEISAIKGINGEKGYPF